MSARHWSLSRRASGGWFLRVRLGGFSYTRRIGGKR